MNFMDEWHEDQKVICVARDLRSYAGHFALSDWNYTRDTGGVLYIKHARRPCDRLHRRLEWAVRVFIEGDDLFGDKSLRMRWSLFKAYMNDHTKGRPDGALDGGNILTEWEETGEYLQFVQPSVGLMISDWFLAEPDNPHARKIAAEMKRIADGYADRITNGEVSLNDSEGGKR